MQETEDLSDSERQSRRGRFKDAVLRTKHIWKKDKAVESKEDFKLSDDVNDFLAAGRKAAVESTIKPSEPIATTYTPFNTTVTAPTQSPGIDNRRSENYSPRPSTSDSIRSGQRSPRGLPVPRLDVSGSQRFPNARPVSYNGSRSPGEKYLMPDNNDHSSATRSHSINSALAKNRSRPRGLSVTFVNVAPEIIGEGGDEAELPPIEIGRIRHQRSRSLSPYLERPSSQRSSGSDSRSPVRRKPVPLTKSIESNVEREGGMFHPTPLRRNQTGLAAQYTNTPHATEDLQSEMQRAFRLDEDGGHEDPFADPEPQTQNVRGVGRNAQDPRGDHVDRTRALASSVIEAWPKGPGKPDRRDYMKEFRDEVPSSFKQAARQPNNQYLAEEYQSAQSTRSQNFFSDMDQGNSDHRRTAAVRQIREAASSPQARGTSEPWTPHRDIGQMQANDFASPDISAQRHQHYKEGGWI